MTEKELRNKLRLDVERINLIRTWSTWFYQHTMTYDGALGRQLAYLWPAIANGNQIEVTKNSAIVRLLHEYDSSESWEIWDCIDIVG